MADTYKLHVSHCYHGALPAYRHDQSVLHHQPTRSASADAWRFRCYGSDYRQKHGASISMTQRRVMSAIEACRTAVLGGHLEQCDQCGHQRNAYNSCGDRHCPKCQSLARSKWLEDRQSELLNTEYFHVVFTLPEQLATIAYHNKRELYGILFRATAQTLLTIAADPKHLGANIGFFAVLHTWGQNLLHHPHLHCVLESLRDRSSFLDYLAPLREAEWVVYAQTAFRRVRAGVGLRRTLYSSRGDLP